MTTAQSEYIEKIATYVNKYREQYGIKVASPIIAQAIHESGWGKSSLAAKYHNHFGMKCGSSWKGKSVNLATKEEYTAGTLTNIRANFRVYDSDEEGVKGYFDFINATRYKNLKGLTDPKTYLTTIKADGYATSSTYVKNLTNTISKYNLTKYDKNNTIIVENNNCYFTAYTGTSVSIVDALKSIGEKYSLAYRKQIAAANGLSSYKGSASQNTEMLILLKNGKLKKP